MWLISGTLSILSNEKKRFQKDLGTHVFIIYVDRTESEFGSLGTIRFVFNGVRLQANDTPADARIVFHL